MKEKQIKILKDSQKIQKHPLGFFLRKNTKVLMLGSFPPKKQRWSMNFYYPNFQNDMWRILGLIFFNDKNYFVDLSGKAFDEKKARNFCIKKAIGIGDSAVEIIRLKNNASDNFLKVIKTAAIEKIIDSIPKCKTIILTGQKAMDIFLSKVSIEEPLIGHFSEYKYKKRLLKVYRMPSTSRAYPKPLSEKADIYKAMFEDIKLL
ncbi:MAG: uracil-DNA glycosylase family protein [Elusimicrobiota bacterium]|jgi:G:T/U-mismatch repair DNA glycosylase|nr:uracil-DNA glycosylase family protein [Elusimicrobiota bacterium]